MGRAQQSKAQRNKVFRRRSSVAFDHPEPFIRGAERVDTMRVLGVVVNSKLTMKDHLDHLLSSCASSIHAMRMPRVHGLQDKQIHVVASMTTLVLCCMHLQRGGDLPPLRIGIVSKS